MTRLHLHVAPPLSVPQAAASIRNRRTCSTYRWWSQSGCWRWAWATTPPSRCTSEPKSCSKPGPEEPNMGSNVTDGWILRLKLCYSHRDRTEEQSGECSERNIQHVDHVISVIWKQPCWFHTDGEKSLPASWDFLFQERQHYDFLPNRKHFQM